MPFKENLLQLQQGDSSILRTLGIELLCTEALTKEAFILLLSQAAFDQCGYTAKATLKGAIAGNTKAITSFLYKFIQFTPYYSLDELHRKRKWSLSMLAFLGEPDLILEITNKAPLKLWKAQTVSSIEGQEIFQIKAHGKIPAISAENMKFSQISMKIELLKKKGENFAKRGKQRKGVRQDISKRRYQKNRNFIYQTKLNKPCVDCGGNFPPAALQFDHLPGFAKNFSISKMSSAGGLALIKQEISKCEIVCNNCHRTRTQHRHDLRKKNRSYPAREKLQEEVGKLKEDLPCKSCNKCYKRWQMDFHHVRGTKLASIAKLITTHATIETILAEIAKCDLLCANCHAVVTATEFNYSRHIKDHKDE